MSSTNPYDAPSQPGTELPVSPSTQRLIIKSIDVVSAATMIGALYAVGGLILGGIFSIIGLVAVLGGNEPWAGGVLGIAAIILFPLIYGAIGFVAGAIGAFVYNLMATMVGGIQLEVKTKRR